MKLTRWIIGLALLLPALLNAQTMPDPPPADTNAPAGPWYSDWIGFVQNTASAKSLVVAAYPGYAPGLVVDGKESEWGAGMALLYPVGQFGFVGGRFDWMGGDLWAPSATVGLQAQVQLFGINVTPFTIGGVIIPVSGAGAEQGEVGGIFGAGINATLLKWGAETDKVRGSLNLFYAYEHWTIFDVGIHRPGLALSFKF